VTASRSPDNVLTVYYYDDFGALYAFEREGARYYVGSDHLGTPKVVTDNTGAVVKMYEYDSWGSRTVLADYDPTLDLPVGFAGGIPDDATGLVRFGFRDYEPGTGRWAAKDPIFFRGGQANLFQYVLNNPVNLIDPTGEVLPLVVVKIVAGVLVGTTAWGYIAPLFLPDKREELSLPPGSPPGSMNPGYPGGLPFVPPPRSCPAPISGR
jgi:RHS repeat-associated protein